MLILTGCNQSKINNSEHPATETTHNPTTKEILTQNPNADIFQHKGIIYTNASNIEWVQQTELTIGEIVGTIRKQYIDGITFENEMATKLPVGAEIFESGQILIVNLDGREIRYLGLIEG
ncbi:hypothetical protein [Paenibacillus selenitireducens]|uniref:hypothetical protein n=1 Tax=Paenibacillus selenitireducens TaxID=1324314 RepID=UPI000997E9B6|nr:hypothetical protein [Paenibacillus selenitireducens]